MNDVFMEYLVKKKKTTADMLKIAAIILGAVIVSLVILFLMLAAAVSMGGTANEWRSMVFGIGMLLVAGAWYGAYLLMNFCNIEYEYILTNNELDIDKVLAKKGRKHLITIDIHNINLMARTDDDQYNSVYKNPPSGVRVVNYSAMNGVGFTYFMDCTVEDERMLVLFQPTQKMIDAMWKFNPQAIKRPKEQD